MVELGGRVYGSWLIIFNLSCLGIFSIKYWDRNIRFKTMNEVRV